MVETRDHLLDATVVPAHIEYPTDAKLLNRARQWVVKGILEIRRRCDVKGNYPVESTGDDIFGTRANRELLKEIGVRGGVKALGRSAKATESREWLREKLKLRGSRMKGIVGHAKSHFGLDRIRYKIKDGEEMWIRLGLLAMNLSTAIKKMGQGGGPMGEARATA
jgi:hypothetical protein